MIRHSRLTALGMMLCLLAALFALEAKIAWFSPAGSATAQISYAKAWPSEPSRTLAQQLAAPDSPAPDVDPIAMLGASILLMAAASTLVVRWIPARPPVADSPGFSAALFFRPPPAL